MISFPPAPLPAPSQVQWGRIAARFDRFRSRISLTTTQLRDGETKHRGVRCALNSWYWASASETANSMLIGSWGKRTRVRPPRDVDVLFQLPYEVFERFERRSGNKQSQLLQEVKEVLLDTYPDTDVSGDGQVVVVPFESYGVEVLPAFLLNDGGYYVCETSNGGSYRTVYPHAEEQALSAVDRLTNGNLRALVRMLKCWQHECNVPMKSFWLEIAAAEFLMTWQFRDQSSYFHDWMVRDFFAFLKRHGGGWVRLPNTTAQLSIGSEWVMRATTAFENANWACMLESWNCYHLAGDEWQKIFGADFS